ncbi:sigma-70 family RNA polymerase sigma factor [Anaerolineae bacterium CFX7]|nr:sigma-70 family RNA polymerase sigma factor [Anaerolineae bacterium CFX7]
MAELTRMEPQIIAAAQRGDKAAFAQIVAEFQTPVYNLAYRMLGNRNDAEDAAQETFLRAYAQLKTYDPGQSFGTWLLSVAAHYCIDRLRRRKFQWLSFDDPRWDESAPALVSDLPSPEASALAREREQEVQRALQKLAPQYRMALVLKYWNDMSLEEISSITGDNVGAVKVKLFRARQMLGKHLRAAPAGQTLVEPNHAG